MKFFRIPKFISILKKIENKIRLESPNIIITIDSPSLNYRLVNKIQDLRKEKIKFFHYVAPTVWAWKKYRAKIFANFMIKCLHYLNLKINIFLQNLNYLHLCRTSNFF